MVEILQALHYVNWNHSFANSSTYNKRSQLMFPDSLIAKSYQKLETELKYSMQFGIAPFIKKKLIHI